MFRLRYRDKLDSQKSYSFFSWLLNWDTSVSIVYNTCTSRATEHYLSRIHKTDTIGNSNSPVGMAFTNKKITSSPVGGYDR